jgi:hypothetical protein
MLIPLAESIENITFFILCTYISLAFFFVREMRTLAEYNLKYRVTFIIHDYAIIIIHGHRIAGKAYNDYTGS